MPYLMQVILCLLCSVLAIHKWFSCGYVVFLEGLVCSAIPLELAVFHYALLCRCKWALQGVTR